MLRIVQMPALMADTVAFVEHRQEKIPSALFKVAAGKFTFRFDSLYQVVGKLREFSRIMIVMIASPDRIRAEGIFS